MNFFEQSQYAPSSLIFTETLPIIESYRVGLSQYLEQMKKGLSPEALLAGGVCTFFAHGSAPLQAGLALSLYELTEKHLVKDVLVTSTATITLVTLLSIMVEAKTLREKHYSISPLSTLLYLAFQKRGPELAAVISNIISLINPVDIGVALYAHYSQDWHILLSTLVAKFVLGSGFAIGSNILIQKDSLKVVVDGLKEAEQSIKDLMEEEYPAHMLLAGHPFLVLESSFKQ